MSKDFKMVGGKTMQISREQCREFQGRSMPGGVFKGLAEKPLGLEQKEQDREELEIGGYL